MPGKGPGCAERRWRKDAMSKVQVGYRVAMWSIVPGFGGVRTSRRMFTAESEFFFVGPYLRFLIS
jgi:hypothetical protein